jgi:para-nitrobenzyl esterase
MRAESGLAHPTDREWALLGRAGLTTVPTTRPAARTRLLAAYSQNLVNIGGDHAFFWPAIGIAQGHAAIAPTWMYRYDYASRLLRLTGFGATHASELIPMFGELDSTAARIMTVLGGRASLRAVSDRMQNHWLHFARHGTPAADWPTYDPGRRQTLIIDQTDRLEDDPRAGRRRAWTGFPDFR